MAEKVTNLLNCGILGFQGLFTALVWRFLSVILYLIDYENTAPKKVTETCGLESETTDENTSILPFSNLIYYFFKYSLYFQHYNFIEKMHLNFNCLNDFHCFL